jgi:hypothetical protein
LDYAHQQQREQRDYQQPQPTMLPEHPFNSRSKHH